MRATNLRVVLCCLTGFVISGSINAEQTLEYQWLTIGEPSGSQIVTIDNDNQRRFTFEFNDRGRGPDTTTAVRLNDHGIPVFFESTGVNYFKGEVNERFEVVDGRAIWSSSVEQGDEPFTGQGFYLPESWSPEYSAILARAILRDEDGVLPLLPSGEARIEKVLSQALNIEGESKTITLYAITGMNPSPDHLWLDEELEMFGFDAGWFGMTPTGWAEHIDTLKEHQTKQTADYLKAFSESVTEPLEGLIAITNARVFDPADGTVDDGSTVFMLNGMITAVYAEQLSTLPEEARVIDAKGHFVMPALWDMHAHIQPGSYFNYLAQGVTNVRDMANDPEYIVTARKDIAAGKVVAPNIHPMGFIDKNSEFAAPTGKLAETLQDAIDYVDFYAQRGFHGIKLYSSIEPEWVPAITRHAHALGMKVLGHIPSGMSAEDAVNAGFDEITHINMVFLNFLGAHEIDTRTPKRFTEVGERAGNIDLQSDSVLAFADLMANKGIALDPTLSIFQDMFRNEPGEVSIVFRDIAEYLPALTKRGFINTAGFNAGHEAAYAAAGDATMKMVRLLHDKGVRLLPGTDNGLPGMTLIRELQFYADAGIPAADVLRLGTLESARHMGLDQQYGRIAPHMRAHLLIVDGDPLVNISDLHRVRVVIKDNQLFRPADILSQQGFKPFE